MSFYAIKGTFHIVGYSPDGDSIRFKAANMDNWKLLKGFKVTPNAKSHVQLRFEAIDTLETHFQNKSQPEELAKGAMKYMLSKTGIRNAEWNDTEKKVVSADDGTPGYIISRMVEKNRRPVSFVYGGESEFDDGAEVNLTPALAAKSINAALLKTGFAYPTYYKGLFQDIRVKFTQICQEARTSKSGIWAKDVTNRGFKVNSLSDVTDRVVILPKLFRRIVKYLQVGGNISGFKEYMEQNEEKIILIDGAHATHFDNIISVNDQQVKMLKRPEEILFDE